MEDNFYIYIYLDPRKPGQYNYGSYEFNYEPFYVGKGQRNRINDKKNDHCENKINIIRGLGFETIRIKLKENLEENYSFEVEKELIKLIGKEILKEGPLTNINDGGEGSSGYEWTEEEFKKQKKEYSEIKNTFERRDYELLTKEEDYRNSKQKLEYIHKKCGRKHSIRWNDFQQEQGCPYCGREEQAKKRRKEYTEIKNEFENIRGCKLTTEEKDYKNNETKLEYIHIKCGRRHSIRWSNFQQGQGCPYCGTEEQAKKRRKEYTEIKNTFEREDYELFEEKDYKNSKRKLEYIHKKCGNKHSITCGNFQQGRRCPYCYGNKIDFSEIKNEFEDIRGCKLTTEEKDYRNNKQKLEYICPKGHKHSIYWNNFQQRKNNYCPKCNKIRRNKICL